MNEKNDYISVAEMLEYMQGHDKAQHMYNDMTILRQTVLDPVQSSKIYIGRYHCIFEPLGNEQFAITCKPLRMFHLPLTKKTIDLMASRYERRILPGHTSVDAKTDLDYLYYGHATEPIGYWYYDERTGSRRAYLYHASSDKTFILKFDCVLKYLIDDDGMEHCSNEAEVSSRITELTAAEEQPEPKSTSKVFKIVQTIKDLIKPKD
jgi:hypothetical protein